MNIYPLSFVKQSLRPIYPIPGFRYIYVTPQDLKELESTYKRRVLHTEEVEEDGETRHKITDVIGAANDIGVENLAGAGIIAGETSQVG